eukprot:COSAG06_NODE_9646_length_1852_cov_1.309755_1_plen_85_part_00
MPISGICVDSHIGVRMTTAVVSLPQEPPAWYLAQQESISDDMVEMRRLVSGCELLLLLLLLLPLPLPLPPPPLGHCLPALSKSA